MYSLRYKMCEGIKYIIESVFGLSKVESAVLHCPNFTEVLNDPHVLTERITI